MYFSKMLYNITTSRFTSFTHVFHKKRKGQEVQKSASSRIRPRCLLVFLVIPFALWTDLESMVGTVELL